MPIRDVCQFVGVWGHGVKGEVRDKAPVEVSVPLALEGENVSYEGFSPVRAFASRVV